MFEFKTSSKLIELYKTLASLGAHPMGQEPFDLQSFLASPSNKNTLQFAVFHNHYTGDLVFLNTISYESIVDTIKATIDKSEYDTSSYDLLYLIDTSLKTVAKFEVDDSDDPYGDPKVTFYRVYNDDVQ